MIYRKWKSTVLILLAIAAAVSIFFGQVKASRNGSVQEKVLRLHVIANSDSEKDQAVKLKVKDAVVEYLKPILQGQETMEETRTTVENILPGIQAVAQKASDTWGQGQQVCAELTDMYFPVKSYGDLTFPAGRYSALRITIGKGEGKNWWCVLFPNLCFVDSVHGIVPEESKEELKHVLTEDEYDSLFRFGGSKYEIRWKFMEIFRDVFS